MAYKLETVVVTNFGNVMDSCAETVPQAKTYNQTHLGVEDTWIGPLFSNARQLTLDMRDDVETYLTALSKALSGSATELHGTVERAVGLEETKEAELDKAYPGNGTTKEPLTPPETAPGTPPRDPATMLSTPEMEVPENFGEKVLSTNWGSPTEIVSGMMEFILWAVSLGGIDFNLLDWISERFGGDWNRFHQVKSAVGHLADYLDVQAENHTQGMAAAAAGWSGEAATAANVFFTHQATQLTSVASQLRATVPEFEAVVRGIKASGEIVTSLLTQILDVAAISWGCYAVAGGAAATGVGAPVGAVLAAICGTGSLGFIGWAAWQIYQEVQTLADLLTSLTALIGLASQFMVGSGALSLPSAYDNLQVP